MVLTTASLSYDQLASALMARHIGGAVNYVGVAETLSITPSAQAAGLAADSLICAFYFAGIFKLASSIGPDEERKSSEERNEEGQGWSHGHGWAR